MKPLFALTAMAFLAACENGLVVPDLRGAAPTPAAAGAPEEVLAPTVQLSDKERFVAAIENNGCNININTIGPIMAQASINQDQLAGLTVELEGEGALAPDGDESVRLTSPNCL